MSGEQTLSLEQALAFAIERHRAGDLDVAENIYQQIIQAVPDYAEAYHLLGSLYLQGGQAQRGLEAIDQALQRQPDNLEFLCNRGEALRLLKRYGEAEQCLRRLLAAKPQHVAALNNLGNTLRDAGRPGEAIAVLEAAVHLQGDHLQARNNLALALRDAGRRQEARAMLDSALALQPDNPTLRNNRGEFLRSEGDTLGALADYRRALQAAPHFAPAFRGFYQCLLEQLSHAPPPDQPVPLAGAPRCDQPEFSVIVCSHRPQRHAAVAATFARALAGEAWELILIDDAQSLAEAYQRGVQRSRGQTLIFSHDDITVLSPQLGVTLRQQLEEADLIGIAGTSRLHGAHWQDAGWPHLHGMVARPLGDNEGGGVDAVFFAASAPLISGIQAIDGCFFAARRQLFERVDFDPRTFDGFHGYDIDLAYAAHLAGLRVAVSTALIVAHDSPGNYDAKWAHYARRFGEKYAAQLSTETPGPRHFLVANLPTAAAAQAFLAELAACRLPPQAFPPTPAAGTYQDWLQHYDSGYQRPANPAAAPLISLLLAGLGDQPAALGATLDSLLAQFAPHWELCVQPTAADAPACAELLATYAARDNRIHCGPPRGDWLLRLPAGDRLAPAAIHWFAASATTHPDATLLYCDEDHWPLDGPRDRPCFKPDWNPDLLSAAPYLGPAVAFRCNSDQRQALSDALLAGQTYALSLHYGAAADPGPQAPQIVHIPRVLYHRAAPLQLAADISDIGALTAFVAATAPAGTSATTAPAGWPGLRVVHPLPATPPLVSIIVPTRDGRLLQACIDSLLAHTRYPRYELLIVDNGSVHPATLAYLQALAESGRARVRRDDRPFNFSALNNAAAKEAQGDLLLFLNDDVEIPAPTADHRDWLEEMVSHALRPQIGAVGARLLYGDGRLQHGGVVCAGRGLLHAHHFLPGDSPGYCGRAKLTQNFAAVTAACLLVSKARFEQVGGFDEAYAVACNDVDLCLKLRAAGYWNLWTPYAELVHHESQTRGDERSDEAQERLLGELRRFLQHWPELINGDPAYNPNLGYDQQGFVLAWPPRLPEYHSGYA